MGHCLNAKAQITGREEVEVSIEIDDQGLIVSAQLRALGGLSFLRLVDSWRGRMNGPLDKVELPIGVDTGAMLLREVLLKVQGRWSPPYVQEQICHCRSVPTVKVHEAILVGAHTAKAVSRATSASTACGTCQPDVLELIRYRLEGPTAVDASTTVVEPKSA